MSTIIFIADGWGSKYGGINSFNYDLCLNLPLNLNCKEHKVICITTGDSLSEKDMDLAHQRNLILINLAKSDFTNSIIKAKTAEYCADTDIWWIGHDIKTGFYAVQCANDTNSKCAIIHHMNYGAYYTYSTNNPIKTDEKQKEQLELLKKADVVFAVGPKLVKSANDILIKLNKKSEAIQLIPGVADIAPIEENLNQFTAIAFGRLNINENDIIKQCKLAVAAFAYTCEKKTIFREMMLKFL